MMFIKIKTERPAGPTNEPTYGGRKWPRNWGEIFCPKFKMFG